MPKKILKMKLSAGDASYISGNGSLSTEKKAFAQYGWGTPTSVAAGSYYLSGSSSVLLDSGFKGFTVAGYNGSFKVSSFISTFQKHLSDVSVQNLATYGGEMICGELHSSTNGNDSECAWVTPTTSGIIQYIKGGGFGVYSNMPATALKLIDHMLVPAK